jgi:hypothetical protein
MYFFRFFYRIEQLYEQCTVAQYSKMLCKLMKDSCCQRKSTLVEKRGKLTKCLAIHETEYIHQGQLYKIRLPRRYQNNIIQIKHNNVDITDIMRPYLGYWGNFNCVAYTPADFEYDQLTLVYLDDTERVFFSNQIMYLT